MKRCLLCLCLVAVIACQPATEGPVEPPFELPSGTVIDLSYSYDENTVFWPTAEGFKLESDFEGMTDKGYFYAANSLCTAEHGGTHIDAPIHFSAGKRSVDRIPLDQLMGPAVLVDVSEQCAADRDYQVSVGDLEDWE